MYFVLVPCMARECVHDPPCFRTLCVTSFGKHNTKACRGWGHVMRRHLLVDRSARVIINQVSLRVLCLFSELSIGPLGPLGRMPRPR